MPSRRAYCLSHLLGKRLHNTILNLPQKAEYHDPQTFLPDTVKKQVSQVIRRRGNFLDDGSQLSTRRIQGTEYWYKGKTAFSSCHGLYKFLRMPFGQKNVPGSSIQQWKPSIRLLVEVRPSLLGQ